MFKTVHDALKKFLEIYHPNSILDSSMYVNNNTAFICEGFENGERRHLYIMKGDINFTCGPEF